jgi:tetrapyrrole methylase family protein/MazG family protein
VKIGRTIELKSSGGRNSWLGRSFGLFESGDSGEFFSVIVVLFKSSLSQGGELIFRAASAIVLRCYPTVFPAIFQGRPLMKKRKDVGRRFERLVEILAVLRSEQGCPWDREQDKRTITDYFLEEVFEAADAATQDDFLCLQEELGDVLMEVVFLAQIYQEKGHFSIAAVLDGIIGKMIRRHPHVFGGQKLETSREVAESWQEQKNIEKRRRSVFEGMSRSAPALLQAFQAGQRAEACGSDWGGPLAALDKVKEKVEELDLVIRSGKPKEIREDIGDLLFSLASLSRLAGQNPELALRASIQKFKRRFRAMERELESRGEELRATGSEDLDKLWKKAKKEPL